MGATVVVNHVLSLTDQAERVAVLITVESLFLGERLRRRLVGKQSDHIGVSTLVAEHDDHPLAIHDHFSISEVSRMMLVSARRSAGICNRNACASLADRNVFGPLPTWVCLPSGALPF